MNTLDALATNYLDDAALQDSAWLAGSTALFDQYDSPTFDVRVIAANDDAYENIYPGMG